MSNCTILSSRSYQNIIKEISDYKLKSYNNVNINQQYNLDCFYLSLFNSIFPVLCYIPAIFKKEPPTKQQKTKNYYKKI